MAYSIPTYGLSCLVVNGSKRFSTTVYVGARPNFSEEIFRLGVIYPIDARPPIPQTGEFAMPYACGSALAWGLGIYMKICLYPARAMEL
jgi:hypothetical protein